MQPLAFSILLILPIGIQRIIFIKKEIAQTCWQCLFAERAAAFFGERIKVESLIAKHISKSFPPEGVFSERMLRVLCQPLQSELQHMDAIARRKVEPQIVAALEELHRQAE